MPEYEHGRVRQLANSLEALGVAEELRDQLLAGGELLLRGASPEHKAAWMREAMGRMDAQLDAATRHAVLEKCACCLGGKRLQLSKAIAKEHATLEERIAAANETRFVFGHSVTREADGRILVRFAPEGQATYGCVCLSKAKEPVSITYCYCCGGHVKHHLQIALGCRLSCTVRSSALSSGGKHPCTFLFDIEEN